MASLSSYFYVPPASSEYPRLSDRGRSDRGMETLILETFRRFRAVVSVPQNFSSVGRQSRTCGDRFDFFGDRFAGAAFQANGRGRDGEAIHNPGEA